jgi:hypothetical protein
MQTIFPPGVTVWEKGKTKSEWREFAFALHLLQQAVDPVLSLKEVLQGWRDISKALAESSRQRKPQLSKYTFP